MGYDPIPYASEQGIFGGAPRSDSEIEHKVQVITIASKAASVKGTCSADPRSGETGATASATCREGDREEESKPLPGYRVAGSAQTRPRYQEPNLVLRHRIVAVAIEQVWQNHFS
jgi:hypothetical protein